jgi:hypothetical protein
MRSAPDPEDIILGTATPPYPHPQFRLTPPQQTFHGLVWGSTGAGKSKLLEAMFVQYFNKGRGVCLIDPHADLSVACIADLVSRGYFEREDAFDRLVYLDFGQGSYPPLNVLAGRFDPHTTALNVLEALTRTWPDLHGAPLFRTLFLSSVTVLIANRLPLTDINALLLDDDFRASCLAGVSDPLVHQTFAFYDRHGRGQAGSTLRRAFLLSFAPIARGCLGQQNNVLDVRALMDSGKSLLVNLGSIPDPVTRRLIGSLIMVQIEQAALSRTDLPQPARRPWTCMVDEWPSFGAAQSEMLENVLTQARKFNLRLYLAAQSLAQIDSRRLAGAFENCRLSITFRLGHDSARLQAQQIGDIDPFRIKQAASAPGQRTQYMSTSEQLASWVQAIQNLPPRQAFVKVHGNRSSRITTLTVPEPACRPEELEAVLAEYRRRYQRPASEVLERHLPAGFTVAGATSVPDTGSNPPATDIIDFDAFFGEQFNDPDEATVT